MAGETALEGSGEVGLREQVHLVDDRPGDGHPGPLEQRLLSTISSIGRPTPPSETMTAGAPSIEATSAFERLMTAPTPACPVPSISRMSRSAANEAWAARMRAGRSSTTRPSMCAWVNPRGMWTGLICVERLGQVEHASS